MERTILHCDLNSFFASVELLSHPELKKMPVAVSGNPENRHGIILAKNEPAKKAGVKTAETIWQAKSKCPDLILLPPHHELYSKYSKKVNEIYLRYTNLVEPFGIDESWLDVTNSRLLFGDGKTIADEIRKTVKEELGLTVSVGVSFNKVLAKLGSDFKKPDGTTVISKENFKEFVWPMKVSELLYVGRSSLKKLNSFGIKTIGDLANADKNMITEYFGKNGQMLYEYANGIDNSPVSDYNAQSPVKSIGNGKTFSSDLTCEDEVREGVMFLSEMVSSRLIKKGLKAGCVQVVVKYKDFETVSRQAISDTPVFSSVMLYNTSMRIILEAKLLKKPIRAITITALSLSDACDNVQLSIFDDDTKTKNKERLAKTIDKLNNKYGEGHVSSARTTKL